MTPIKSIFKPATEMAITSDNFARRFLIFKPGQLVLPTIPLQEFFTLPRNAAYHYVSTDGLSKGPNAKDWHLASIERKMPVQLITALTREQGNPSKLVFNVISENDKFLRMNRTLRRSNDVLSEDPGEQSAIIFNYAYLPKLYRYSRSLFSEYYRWSNIWGTVIDTIVKAKDNPRTHLLFLPLPKVLPSMMGMRAMVKKNAAALVREMPDNNAWMFFELWKWLDPNYREQSLFGSIPIEQLNKVTIIFEDAGRTMGFNLGLINSWIIDKENTPAGQKVKIAPLDIQKRIIRGCIGLMQQRPDSIGTNEDSDIQVGVSNDDGISENEVRVLQETDNQPLAENVADDSKFDDRVDDILKNLDTDIDSHDKASVIIETDDSDVILTESIKERGDHAAITTFEQVDKSIEDVLNDRLEHAVSTGQMTAIEFRRYNRFAEAAAFLTNPYGGDELAKDFCKVELASTLLPTVDLELNDNSVIDKSMESIVFAHLDGDYIRNTLKKDVVASVQGIQKAGIMVTSHVAEQIEDITGAYENHVVKVVPIDGVPSIIRFKGVVIDDNGVIEAGGNKLRYRRQRVDLPIRKISPYQVALASYYGKTFVSRCDRASYSYNRFIQKQIGLRLVEEASPFSVVHTGDCFDHQRVQPRSFSAMAQTWRGMEYNGISLRFNLKNQEADFGKEAVEYATNLKMTIFGKKTDGTLYTLDENNTVYSMHDGNFDPVGVFEIFMGLDESAKPVEFTECRIFGKSIPSGLVLGYYFGISGLIKMLDCTVRQVPTGTRLNLSPNEWSLVFEDYSLVFNQDDKVATLILSGLNQASKVLKRYSMFHFDQPAVYFNVLDALGMSSRYIRELDTLKELFVDPITERVLKRMGEPTTYPQLVKRATEMLVTEEHKRKLDPTEMRYRGAERIAGAIYNQLTQAVREQRAKSARASSKIEMSPYSVWKHTMTDPSLSLIEDVNPIHNLKEILSVTYTGHGGRNSRSMTRSQRAMDPNDLGTLSEATVDSSDVGFNAYLSVSPRFDNTEGMIKAPISNPGSASMLSPAALASACIVNDDGKRIGMSSIQHSHTIACDSYTNNTVRTGFERTMSHQVDDNFAVTAKQNGIIKSGNANGLILQYEDGTTQAIPIGRRFGRSGGLTLPHDMATLYNVGEEFKKDDVLVYHKGFFKPDRFKKGVVNWMNGTIARTVFMESRKTHEDASSISASFAARNGTRVTKVRDIVVGFDQLIHNLVDEGNNVRYDGNLCLIEDKLSAQANLFTGDSLNTLKSLSSQSPLAKVTGVVDRIEVFYHGDTDDMSDSLREIVESSDKRLSIKRKASGKTVVTGLVDDGFRVGGEPLQVDTACIRVYITHYVGASSGDKVVFGWQLKSEISEVFANSITTADGQPVDAFYGAKSLFARVVYSAFKIGTATSLMGTIGRQMAQIYKGTRKP